MTGGKIDKQKSLSLPDTGFVEEGKASIAEFALPLRLLKKIYSFGGYSFTK